MIYLQEIYTKKMIIYVHMYVHEGVTCARENVFKFIYLLWGCLFNMEKSQHP